MRYVDEFRNKNRIERISDKISRIMPKSEIRIMEVCGTHTQGFHRFSLHKLIPENLRLISGPGCPVCVSTQDYIDKAVELSKDNQVIIVTFGDMLRVPGTNTSLAGQRARGCDVRIVYSAWDSLKIARENPEKSIVFLAVGFETTAPTLALTLKTAKKEGLNNLFFFSALKLIPPAMKALVSDRRLKIDGFLCPGHVSAVIGSRSYEFIPKRYKIACCVAGFEPLDILEALYLLVSQIIQNKPRVENQYSRVVKPGGNPKAKSIINQHFCVINASWRGLGRIPDSGLGLREGFSDFDIKKIKRFNIDYRTAAKEVRGCRCGEVLKGIIQPLDCSLFAKPCSPDNPYGPCMVSSEGTCNAYYRYGK